MQLVEDRFAKTCGTSLYDAGNHAAYGIALGLHLHNELRHLLCNHLIRATDSILFCPCQVIVKIRAWQDDVTYLLRIGLDADAKLAKSKLGKGTTHDAADSLAGGTASTAPIITDAVLPLVGEVSVRGTEHVAHILVILAVLVGIAHQETDGATSRLALEDATEELYFVLLLAGSSEFTLPGLASGQFALNKGHIDLDASRHTVDDTSNGRTMTLTERGETEKGTYGVHKYYRNLKVYRVQRYEDIFDLQNSHA